MVDIEERQLVVSVRHSGTHTLKELIKCRDNVHTDSTLWLMNGHYTAKDLEQRILWIPLRNPIFVWTSWVKRRVPGAKGFNYSEADFVESWARLDWVYQTYNPIVVPVDQKVPQLRLNENNIAPLELFEKLEKYPWIDTLDGIYDLPLVKRYYNDRQRQESYPHRRDQERQGHGG